MLMLVGAVLCVLGTPAHSANEPPPPPGLGIRLLEAPTNRANDPRARVYVIDRVAPGAVFTRKFEISNGDRDAMSVRLYPAAAEVREGSFAVKDFGVPGEITQWASITPATAQLPSGGRAQATVTFRVDPKATEGEYYGAVVAERPAPKTGSGVGVNLRIALRVYLSVGPGGEPASDFAVDSLRGARDATGAPMVVAEVKNTGGRALDLTGVLRLSDGPGGVSAGPFPVRLGTTLGIGQTSPVTSVLSKELAAGPWLAKIELKSGILTRSAQATISFPEGKGTSGPPVAAVETRPEDGAAFPIAVGIGALLLLGLFWLLFLLWRRRDREEEEEPS
jgi:hypothetical protein